jgi:hypothetical protein
LSGCVKIAFPQRGVGSRDWWHQTGGGGLPWLGRREEWSFSVISLTCPLGDLRRRCVFAYLLTSSRILLEVRNSLCTINTHNGNLLIVSPLTIAGSENTTNLSTCTLGGFRRQPYICVPPSGCPGSTSNLIYERFRQLTLQRSICRFCACVRARRN